LTKTETHWKILVVLDQDRLSTTRLKLLPREPIGKLLEAGGFKKTTETVTDGLINLQEANQQLRSSLTGLQEDVQLVLDTDVYSSAVSGILEAFIEELTDRISTTTERLSVVRSQGDGLGDAIEQTNEVQDWFDEVRDVWNRRLASLYRFDVQLTAGNGRFEWADDDAQSEITAQRDALVDFDGSWWTTDGWKAFVADTTSGLGTELQRSWEAYLDQQGISEFVDRIADHPWVIPAPELPNGSTGGDGARVHHTATRVAAVARDGRWSDCVALRMTKTRFCRLLTTSQTSSHSPRPSNTT